MGGADAPLRPRPDRRRRRGPERLARPRLRPRGGEDRARRPPAREAGGFAASSAPPPTAATPPTPPRSPPCSASWTRPAARPPPWSTTRAAARAAPLVDLDPEEVRQDLLVTAYGGFLVAQEAVRRMLPRREGAVVFTGASASVKGYARSSLVRDGQVRAPRARPEHGARAAAAGHPRRPPRRSTAASATRAAPSPPTGRTACSTPTRSPNLPRPAAPAAQRLDLGGGAAAVGRDLLTSSARGRCVYDQVPIFMPDARARRVRRAQCPNEPRKQIVVVSQQLKRHRPAGARP